MGQPKNVFAWTQLKLNPKTTTAPRNHSLSEPHPASRLEKRLSLLTLDLPALLTPSAPECPDCAATQMRSARPLAVILFFGATVLQRAGCACARAERKREREKSTS